MPPLYYVTARDWARRESSIARREQFLGRRHGWVLRRSVRGFDKVSRTKQPRRELGLRKGSRRSKPRGGGPAGRLPRIPYDRAPTASRVRRLKHHDQACFSAGKVWWRAQSGESLRLLPRAEGGTMACQRAAFAIERSSVPIISTVAARSRLRMRRSIAPSTLPCMSPARPLGFESTGVKDRCPAATHGAGLAIPRRPSAPVPSTLTSATSGILRKARCAYNCVQNPRNLATDRIIHW